MSDDHNVAKPRLLRIRDWAARFETSETRKLRNLTWIPESTDVGSDVYASIVNHPDGAAHYGVFVMLHIVASKSKPRGDLRRSDGRPHDAVSLSQLLRVSEKLVADAIERLISLGELKIEIRKSLKNQRPRVPQVQENLPDEGKGMDGMDGMEYKHSRVSKDFDVETTSKPSTCHASAKNAEDVSGSSADVLQTTTNGTKNSQQVWTEWEYRRIRAKAQAVIGPSVSKNFGESVAMASGHAPPDDVARFIEVLCGQVASGTIPLTKLASA
jgi:hypothetical protein